MCPFFVQKFKLYRTRPKKSIWIFVPKLTILNFRFFIKIQNPIFGVDFCPRKFKHLITFLELLSKNIFEFLSKKSIFRLNSWTKIGFLELCASLLENLRSIFQ